MSPSPGTMHRYAYPIVHTALLILAIFAPSPLVGIGLLLFPSLHFVKVTRNNILVALPLIVLSNIVFVLSSTVMFAVLNIPLRTYSFLAFGAMIYGTHVLLQRKKQYAIYNPPGLELLPLLYIYAGFCLALVTRVFSTRGTQAPTLHDPIAHTFWTQIIIDKGSINFFYSPGLHVLSSLLSENSTLDAARSLHFMTMILSASCVFIWPFIALVITKNKFFATFLTATITLAPLPANLYYLAGKNSFIAAVTLAPLLFLATYYFAKNPRGIHAAGIVLTATALLIVHYPTAGYFIAYTCVVLIGVVASRRKNRAQVITTIKMLVAMGVGSLALLGSWYFYVKQYRHLETQGLFVEATAGSPPDITRLINPIHYWDTIRDVFFGVRIFASRYSQIYLAIGSLCLICVPFIFRRKDIYIHIFFFSICCFFTMVILRTYISSGSTPVLVSTGYMLVFVIFAMAISAIASFIFEHAQLSRLMLVLLIITVSGVTLNYSLTQYRRFRSVSLHGSSVTHDDVEAFRWINNHIPPGSLFLNNVMPVDSKTRIFSSDAGGWIPIYTKSKITSPFHNGLGRIKTYTFYTQYKLLESEPDKALCRLYKNNVRYYYHDLRTPHPSAISTLEHIDEVNRDLIFSNTSVRIYKLNVDGLHCSA